MSRPSHSTTYGVIEDEQNREQNGAYYQKKESKAECSIYEIIDVIIIVLMQGWIPTQNGRNRSGNNT